MHPAHGYPLLWKRFWSASCGKAETSILMSLFFSARPGKDLDHTSMDSCGHSKNMSLRLSIEMWPRKALAEHSVSGSECTNCRDLVHVGCGEQSIRSSCVGCLGSTETALSGGRDRGPRNFRPLASCLKTSTTRHA